MKAFKVSAIYDTETTNVDIEKDGKRIHKAFPVLFIFNRVSNISDYIPDESDSIAMFRNSSKMIIAIDDLIDEGIEAGFIPIVCAYNLMFDLQPLMFELSQRYDMKVNAQNSVSVYTLDLISDGETVLRFWDTFFLEMNGLSAMGRTCGYAKAEGEWNYDLIRSQETELTLEELDYAKRDVQVIPAYLRWILETNPYLDESDLGFRVLTKTSLVRQMARRTLGNLAFVKENGNRMKIIHAFELTCKQEMPEDFNSYAIRKACFRGGFTFTSARFAMIPVRNVASLDVVSMHHAFINGRRIPIRFRRSYLDVLDNLANALSTYDLEAVLESYSQPFPFAFHAKWRISNVRLKKGSCFDRWKIGLLSTSKFAKQVSMDESMDSLPNITIENTLREKNYRDSALNPTFAFGKLYAADSIDAFMNEIELWNFIQVYDFDSISALEGECTFNFIVPPDYVTIQSNVLFELKSVMKAIVKLYREGEPYPEAISPLIPNAIAESLKVGSISESFLESYYTSTIKGQFNGIYGTQAQDVFKPSFEVEDGEIKIDAETIPDSHSFDDLTPKNPKVLYTYGQRIVAGSRMHLIIAMMLLDKIGNRIDILAGDTDSLKIRCDCDISDSELLEALNPLHNAVAKAIDEVQSRLRREFPDYASSLQSIGLFEVENSGKYYDFHMECWNKARISYDGKAHITCAGLSRPAGKYNIEDAANDLISEFGFEKIAPKLLKFDAWIRPELSHSLGHSIPDINERFHYEITDYLGNASQVDEYASIALYPIGRMLGSTSNANNRWTFEMIGDRIDDRITIVGFDGKPYIRTL